MKILIAVLAWFALVSMAVSGAGGADWREWFGQPRPEAAVAQSPDDEIPDLPGAAPKRSSQQGPNALQRFNSGTKKFFSRTRQALTPKKKAPAKSQAAKDRPFQGWMPNASRKAPKSSQASTGFSSWFGQKEPETQSATLEDFMSKPRP